MRNRTPVDDEAIAEEQNEHRLAQQEHNRNSRSPEPKGGRIARYWKGQDCPDKYTCDAFYVDRKTGTVVLRYDMADPANTNPYYGARPDSEYFAENGRNLKELMRPEESVVTEAQLRAMCRRSIDELGDYGDDGAA